MRRLLPVLATVLVSGCIVVPPPSTNPNQAPPPAQPATQAPPPTEAPPPQPVQETPAPPATPPPQPVQETPPPPANPPPMVHRVAPARAPRVRMPTRVMRRRVRITLTAPGSPYPMDAPIALQVTLTNGNREPVLVHALAPGFMHFAIGRNGACRGGPTGPTPARPGRFLVLMPGETLQRTVNLTRFCGPLPVGRWQVILDYHVPGGLGRPRAITGTKRGVTHLAVRGYTPPPAPPASASLDLGVARPPRTHVGEPVEIQVTLTNRGGMPIYALPPAPDTLHVHLTRTDGSTVACRQPAPRRWDQGDLELVVPGRELSTVIHLRDRCNLRQPGRYTLQVTYRPPPADVGRLPWNVRQRLFTGSLEAHPWALLRDPGEAGAPPPPANAVTLDATGPNRRLRVRGPVPVRLTVTNRTGRSLGLPVPNRLFVFPHIIDASGGVIPCRPSGIGTRPRMQALARAVGPGSSLGARVDLAQICNPLGAGRYQVTMVYDVPNTRTQVPGPRGPVWVWSGRTRAPAFTVVVGRGEGPPPPEAGGPAPAPRIWLTTPGRRARAGGKVPVVLHVAPPQNQPYATARPKRWMVRVEATDRNGQDLSCTVSGRRDMRPDRGDFVVLSPQDELDLHLDLANICGIDEHGRYQVTAHLVIPRRFDGQRFGLNTWTGRETTAPVTVRVRGGRDDNGRGDNGGGRDDNGGWNNRGQDN